MTGMITAMDAAKYLLTLDEPESAGDVTSNLKLQKLLYYAQGAHLAIHGAPLFADVVEAWDHGPVCPTVYHTYKSHGAGAIPIQPDFDPEALPAEAKEILKEVHTVYGQFSAWRLREMTHEESPWKTYYREGVRNIVIPHEAMKSFFASRLIGS